MATQDKVTNIKVAVQLSDKTVKVVTVIVDDKGYSSAKSFMANFTKEHKSMTATLMALKQEEQDGIYKVKTYKTWKQMAKDNVLKRPSYIIINNEWCSIEPVTNRSYTLKSLSF